jgi:hypothetical protein
MLIGGLVLRPLGWRQPHIAAAPLQPSRALLLLRGPAWPCQYGLQLCIAVLAGEVHALCPISIHTK